MAADANSCPLPTKKPTMSGIGLRNPGFGTALNSRELQTRAERTLFSVSVAEAVFYWALAVLSLIMALAKTDAYKVNNYWTPQAYLGTWTVVLRQLATLNVAWLFMAMSIIKALQRSLQVAGLTRTAMNKMITEGRNPMRCYIDGIAVGGLGFAVYYIASGSHVMSSSATWVGIFIYWVLISASEKLNPPARGTKGTNSFTDWSVFIGATVSGALVTAIILANLGNVIKEKASEVDIYAYIVVFGFILLGIVQFIVNYVNLRTVWLRNYMVVEYLHRFWAAATFAVVVITTLVARIF